MITAEKIIELMQLEKHAEGGYFRRTYCSKETCLTRDQQSRTLMTSIYYLLTQESHLSYFSVNKSDLVLYHHLGDPLKIIFLYDSGEVVEKILGTDIAAGQTPQIVCPGGVWKAYDLMVGTMALVGESVSPGFDYDDMQMLSLEDFKKYHPQHIDRLKKYICPTF